MELIFSRIWWDGGREPGRFDETIDLLFRDLFVRIAPDAPATCDLGQDLRLIDPHLESLLACGAHGRQDPVQMVVLMLDQFRHVVVHLHLPVLPVLILVAEDAVAVALHAHQQIRE